MKIGIIGVGSLGSVIASRLADSLEQDFYLLADGERKIKLEQKGLLVNDKHYYIPCASTWLGKLDLIIICTKIYQLPDACSVIKEYVDSNTIILPLLNGVTPVSIIKEHLGIGKILYGYITKVDSMRDSNNGFKYNIAGEIHFGYEHNTEIDNTCYKIKNILSSAGFSVYIDVDMLRGVWRKWMLNIGANQVSALTEANYLDFGRISEVKQLLHSAMEELLVLAKKEGVDLRETDVDELIEYLTTYKFPKKTSMLQDVLAKRKTEIETISGDVIKLSKKWNIPCPVNETMYRLIRIKEQVYLY